MSGKLVIGTILGVAALAIGIGFWQGQQPDAAISTSTPISTCSARLPLLYDYPLMLSETPFADWGLHSQSGKPEITPFGVPPQLALSWKDDEALPQLAASAGVPEQGLKTACLRYRFYLSLIEDLPSKLALPGLYRGAVFGCGKEGNLGESARVELVKEKVELVFRQPDGMGGCLEHRWPVPDVPNIGDWITVEQEWALPNKDNAPMQLRLWMNGVLKGEFSPAMRLTAEEPLRGLYWQSYPTDPESPLSAARISQLSLWAEATQ